MTAPTVNVTCAANDQNGNPVAGALFVARLDRTEIYDGFVVPEQFTGVANADGVCVLQLWPNALGVASSQYKISAVNPDDGRRFLNSLATIPNNDCFLHEVMTLEPYPPINAAQQALVAAQNALAPVQAAAAEALGYRDDALNSANTAVAAASAASASADSAAASELAAQAAADAIDGFIADIAAPTGSALVGFQQAGAGAVARTVEDELRERVSVKQFGAVGDGVTDDLDAINNAIQRVFGLGGGDVLLGPFVYGVTGEVVIDSRVRLVGVPGATEIKFIGNTDSQVISHPYRGTGNFLEDAGMYGIICNANRAVQPQVVATSCATFDPCKRLRIESCTFKGATGYGFGLQSGPGLSDTNESEDVTLIDVVIDDNGFGVADFDGLDVKSVKRMTMINVTSKNNAGDGLDFRGEDVVLINCKAHDNDGSGLEISASVNGSAQNSSVTVIGGSFYGNAVAGARMASGASGTGLCRVTIQGGSYYSNTGDGIAAINSGDRVRASIDGAHAYLNGGHGVACMASHQMFHLSNVEAFNNTGSGVYALADGSVRMVNVRSRLNARYGYEEATNSSRNVIGSGCFFRNNTLGDVLLNTNLRIHVARDFADYSIGVAGGDIIASAAAITFPFGGDTFAVTGTTNIQTINGGFRNRQVTLFLGSGITIEHATGNIRLASGTNITTTASRSTLTLAYDGGLWRQVAYSSVP